MPQNVQEIAPLLTLSRVSKRFGETQALSEIEVMFQAGKCHALVGENGAGKSTLGKILLGVHQPDQGEILLEGTSVSLSSPAEGGKLGLVGIAQELSLLPERSVVDNIALGREITNGPLVNTKKTRQQVLEVMRQFDMYLEPDILVGELPVAEQQKVEILRALSRDAKLIVFDEPTARLATHEASQLLQLIKSLAENGKAVIYVSHFLEEVLEISDTITVLRNGEHVRTNPTNKETRDSLIIAMTGQDLQHQYPQLPKLKNTDTPILKVKNLSRKNEFENISFEIRPGEIVGLAGLVGSGRSELAHAIYGSTMPDTGQIEFCGEAFVRTGVEHSIMSGIALIPEARRTQGLVLGRSILENTSLPYLARLSSWLGLNKAQELSEVNKYCSNTQVKHAGLHMDIDSLSGGNQQKILFARAAMGAPKMLIADEPTRGVDIGAKRSIYDLIADMASKGEAVLLISSEIEEILGMCHRALVMSRGQIVAELSGRQLTKKAVMKAAFSGV
ncbi:MAG: sugar ABC transporter ATP-binding protein [Rhizobiaceae bacterium]|nr:sugar ABC transporter ATP-binding protein [Rhizobiaceae bacterium]